MAAGDQNEQSPDGRRKMLRTRSWVGGLLGVVLLAGPAGLRGAEADPLLPEDTEVIMTINVKQLMESGLAKKFDVKEKIKTAIEGSNEASTALSAMGLDPTSDFDRVTVAASASSPDKALIIVRGKFDKKKIETALKAAKDDKIKETKVGGMTAFEFSGQGQTMVGAILNDKAIVLSNGEDAIKAAGKRADAKDAPTLKSKAFAALLNKADSKATMQLLAVNNKTDAQIPNVVPADIAELLEKVETMTAAITVADDVKMAIEVSTKDAESAEKMNDLAKLGIGLGKDQAPKIARRMPAAGLLVDLAESAKTAVKDKTVTVTGSMSGSAIEKAVKALGQ
jgi:hypothetical protein